MKGRHTPTRSAFTFIEVLVALAIAAIALLGLLRLHLFSMASADVAQATTEAVFLAEEKLAEASAGGYPQRGTKSGTVEQNGRRYAWQVDVTDARLPNLHDLTLNGLHQVQALVTWEYRGSRKRVQMTTYVADSRIHE